MALADFRRSVRQRYPTAFALHREVLELLEPSVEKPRRHDGLLELAVDMLFIQCYKAHISVMILSEHGHMEDAATMSRRLLELAAEVGYLGLPPNAETRLQRAKRYLADLWLDLPPEVQQGMPTGAKQFWSNLAEGVPRGAFPSFQRMFSEFGRQDTYDEDYRLLSRIAHGASSDQIIAFAANTIPVRPLWHLDAVMVVASRYFVAAAHVWNDNWRLLDQPRLDDLTKRLADWRPDPPSEAA